MNNQKAALLKKSLKLLSKKMPHSSKNPVSKTECLKLADNLKMFNSLEDLRLNSNLDNRDYIRLTESDIRKIKVYFLKFDQRIFDKPINKPEERKGRPPGYLIKEYSALQAQTHIEKTTKDSIAWTCEFLNIKEGGLFKFFKDNPDIFAEFASAVISFSKS